MDDDLIQIKPIIGAPKFHWTDFLDFILFPDSTWGMFRWYRKLRGGKWYEQAGMYFRNLKDPRID